MKHQNARWCLTLLWLTGTVVPLWGQSGNLSGLPKFSREAYVLGDRPAAQLQILEAGFPVQATTVSVGPVEQIILALDTSVSMKFLYPKLSDQIRKAFPEKLPVPIMLATFNEQVDVITEFTTSRQALEEAASKIRASDRGTAIFEAVQSLQSYAGRRRTHLILITDGADTRFQKVRLGGMLQNKNLVVSYLNWSYRDRKLKVDEPGEPKDPDGTASAKHSKEKLPRRVNVQPDDALSIVAERSGGDVVNLANWKDLTGYLNRRLSVPGVLHRLTWESDNPECSFQVSDPEHVTVVPPNGQIYRRHW